MTERDLFIGIKIEHVLQALQRIDEEGYPPPRRSTTYDLVYNGKAYPPKYVISLAGFFRNGKFIRESLFSGGETSASFPYLRELGFNILTKEEALNFVQSKQNADVQNKYLETNSDMEVPAFFTQKDFDMLAQFTGKSADRDVKELSEAYDYLKGTYNKVDYWATEVCKKAFPGAGEVTITRKPTNQANKFEAYQWAKIYPSKELLEWKNLAYTLTFSNREYFCIKIDTVRLSDSDPLRKNYQTYLGDFFNSPIVKFLKPEEILPTDWNTLIDKSVAIILQLRSDYEKLLELLGYSGAQVAPSVALRANTNNALNTILYGPPGTGKTYHSIDKAVSIATGTSSDHTSNKKIFDTLRAVGQIEFVTFHQNYGYEDFMAGIAPDISSENLKFRHREGVFKRIADQAKSNWLAASKKEIQSESFSSVFERFFYRLMYEDAQEIEIPMRSKGYSFRITSIDLEQGRIKFTKQSGGTSHDLLVQNVKKIYEGTLDYGMDGLGVYYYPLVEKLKASAKVISDSPVELKNFVLVIDEINRANISKVFGELITLIEDDKRLGEPNELTVTLPSGDIFGVPPNLYIIGTMNTADKSIALIDIALRRRFEFIGKYPDYEVLRATSTASAKLLEILNTAIYKKKSSADFLVGHAYFLKDIPIKDTLATKVIPLLMEYFSGKTEIITEVFNGTGWKVKYNVTNFQWDIDQESNV